MARIINKKQSVVIESNEQAYIMMPFNINKDIKRSPNDIPEFRFDSAQSELIKSAVQARLDNCYTKLQRNINRVTSIDENNGIILYLDNGGYQHCFNAKSANRMQAFLDEYANIEYIPFDAIDSWEVGAFIVKSIAYYNTSGNLAYKAEVAGPTTKFIMNIIESFVVC